ncbi:MAG: hypothetical protein DU430_01955, partial [Candidatus Tokpelaia sp.]
MGRPGGVSREHLCGVGRKNLPELLLLLRPCAGWAKQGFPPGTEAFAYKDNVLAVENVLLPVIAASVGTPFYVYS